MEMSTAKLFSGLDTAPPSTQEIPNAIDKLKADKAGGIDNTPPEFFKEGGPTLL